MRRDHSDGPLSGSTSRFPNAPRRPASLLHNHMIEDRFWSKVDKDGPVPDYRPELGPCWLWTAGQWGEGYGRFWVSGRPVSAHRFAYEFLVGPIPSGLQIDHLCRVRNCVNPAHMEPVTNRVNTLRGMGPTVAGLRMSTKTHCPQGHPYDEANTRWWRNERLCRACGRACVQRRRQMASLAG